MAIGSCRELDERFDGEARFVEDFEFPAIVARRTLSSANRQLARPRNAALEG